MIYDEFVKDREWQRLNEALHTPGLTYRERDALRGALDVREDYIRKEQSERDLEIKDKYREYKKREEI